MSEIMESNYTQIKSYIERNNFPFTEKEEQGCKRLDVQHGKAKCAVKVYTTGTIQLQGADSKLKQSLEEAKNAVENEEDIGEVLPFEIERFPEVLTENIPNIDPIVARVGRMSRRPCCRRYPPNAKHPADSAMKLIFRPTRCERHIPARLGACKALKKM